MGRHEFAWLIACKHPCFLRRSYAECMWVIMWFYRPKWEGGEYEGEDEPRFEALQLAMELGAEYVDIELKVGPEYSISFLFR